MIQGKRKPPLQKVLADKRRRQSSRHKKMKKAHCIPGDQSAGQVAQKFRPIKNAVRSSGSCGVKQPRTDK
jgi:hypothetical protein